MSRMGKTCHELGLCQRQFGKLPCGGCTVENDEPLRLAPGVIDFGHPTFAEYVQQQRLLAMRRVCIVVGVIQAVLTVVFMAAGWLAGKLS